MIRTTLSVLTAMALLAALLPSGEAAKATATSAEVTLEILSPTQARATIQQNWEDQAAKSMRQSLDAFFGAGDGKLTDVEVGRIATASETDMLNQTLPFVLFDGQPAVVKNVNLSILGAEGQVISFTPMSMKHVVDLELVPAAGDQHEVKVQPLWSGTLRVSAPSDWYMGEPTGIERSGNTDSHVEGAMLAERPATIPYAIGAPITTPPPGTDVTPTPSTMPSGPPEESSSAMPIPAGGSLLVIVALVGAALLAVRRRRVP